MLYFNYNGKILKDQTPIIGPDNRGLRYGDGLFETIKYNNGQLILIDEHLSRLWKGMQLMRFEIPRLFSPDIIQEQIIELLKKHNHFSARIRLVVLRKNGGLYDTKSHQPDYIIQTWPLAEYVSLNENGLQLCIYRDAKKSIDTFSNLKHNNFLPYFMGALYAKEQFCNDAIILNNFNCVCDCTIANIFIIKQGIIYTPSLAQGCVAGVMRKFIIHQLIRAGYDIIETVITEDNLKEADEIFLSNSIFNIRWVATLGDKTYSNTVTAKIYQLLRQTNPTIFC